jgi:hypothetical protein
MNLAIPAIGFEDMSSLSVRQKIFEETYRVWTKFVTGTSRNRLPKFDFQNIKTYNKQYFTLYTGKYTGIMSRWNNFESKEPVVESLVPFVDGQVLNILPMDQLIVDRLIRDESYVVDAGPITSGVTLVFSLQNPVEYLKLMESIEQASGGKRTFSIEGRSDLGDMEMKAVGGAVRFGALSRKGRILLPVSSSRKLPYSYLPPFSQVHKETDETDSHILNELTSTSEKSDQAYDRQAALSRTAAKRMANGENLYSIVDTMFMPCGSECDLYSVLGEIEEVMEDENRLTGAKLWILLLNCNGIRMTVCVPKKSCEGIPAKGRRYEGDIWLRGSVRLVPGQENPLDMI